jgi:hypothetical protein
MADQTTVKPLLDIGEIVERHVQRYQWGEDTLHGAVRSAIDEALAWRPIDDDARNSSNELLLARFETFGLEWADDPAPIYYVGRWNRRENAWCDIRNVLHNQQSHPTHYMPIPPPLKLK